MRGAFEVACWGTPTVMPDGPDVAFVAVAPNALVEALAASGRRKVVDKDDATATSASHAPPS